MREIAAIVESVIDINQLTREILKEHIALQDDERNADAHERKSVGFREAAARRRVEIGRRLIQVKGETKHGGWMPYLEKCGISQQNAHNWMRLAGYVEEVKSQPSAIGCDLPTRREVNEAHQRSEQPDPLRLTTPTRAPEPEPLDIDRELSRLNMKIVAFAEGVPVKARKQLAHELREIASLVEEMQ